MLTILPCTVVLGADSPVGVALATQLELAGFVVIASVSAAESISNFESQFNGYVKALVLDPEEVSSSNLRSFPLLTLYVSSA